jgi:TPR repeat protein
MQKSQKPQTNKKSSGQVASSDKPKQLRSRRHTYSFGPDCDIESIVQAGCLLYLNPKGHDEWMMAETCLTHAAQEGHVGAQIHLGRMLSSGNPFNGQRDPEKASVWFRIAAEQGDSEAMMDFGMVLFTGDGITRDPVVALQWIEKAAALEHNDALSALGTFYLRGSEGYDKDTSKGLELLEKAYLKGSAEAAFLLGIVYLRGDDVTPNIPLGIKHLKFASENDLLNASYHLGMLYMSGQEVKQDKLEAAKLFTNAAERGHTSSQYAIGMMCLGGDGIEQDIAAAEYWISTAHQTIEGSGYAFLG